MAELSNNDELAAELDALRAHSQQVYSSKDIDAYRELFTADLQYTQPDGKTIDRSQLMKDVEEQFARLHSMGTTFIRHSLKLHSDGRVTETMAQSSWIKLKVFLFFKRQWNVERYGEYTYRKIGSSWRIEKVVVLNEKVQSLS